MVGVGELEIVPHIQEDEFEHEKINEEGQYIKCLIIQHGKVLKFLRKSDLRLSSLRMWRKKKEDYKLLD
ncbi:hypothetical protein HID58_062101, partial [Brassica napus]